VRVGMPVGAKSREQNGAHETSAAAGASESGVASRAGGAARALGGLAHPARLKSLRVQMSLGSALIALGAILLVTLFALFSITTSFNDYRRNQLTAEVNQLALVLGRQQITGDAATSTPGGLPHLGLGPLVRQRFGAANMWVMDAAGRMIVTPQADGPDSDGQFQRDEAVVTDALHRAIGGASIQDTLPGSSLPWASARYYAAAPVREVRAGGAADGPIIGAVALSTLSRTDRALTFVYQVNGALLAGALAAALLAGLLAYYFSRRLTRPVARLTTATAAMAAGEYATRVQVAAPEELHRLAAAFNEMAAALEADVTALRRQEQLRRELVANVAHELATPLTAIQGFTEALLDGVVHDPDERAESTRLIAREAGRLRRLVGQLRQVALYDAGAETLARGPVALPELVDETLAVLGPEFDRREIRLTSVLPGDLPPVSADADRLTEILLNLLDNALRHTPAGGIIEVTAARDGQMVRLAIADTGPGIPPAERERIFDRFYRLDASRTAATGGSGLGLAIVRSLVAAHGGTITVDERPGGGARFTVALPVA
jgi:two-component system sensor histidine kinase BaeS